MQKLISQQTSVIVVNHKRVAWHRYYISRTTHNSVFTINHSFGMNGKFIFLMRWKKMDPIYSGIYWHSVKIFSSKFYVELNRGHLVSDAGDTRDFQFFTTSLDKRILKARKLLFLSVEKNKAPKASVFSPLFFIFCRNGAKNLYLCKDEQHQNIFMSSAERWWRSITELRQSGVLVFLKLPGYYTPLFLLFKIIVLKHKQKKNQPNIKSNGYLPSSFSSLWFCTFAVFSFYFKLQG